LDEKIFTSKYGSVDSVAEAVAILTAAISVQKVSIGTQTEGTPKGILIIAVHILSTEKAQKMSKRIWNWI
jgi:hypothetical protein